MHILHTIFFEKNIYLSQVPFKRQKRQVGGDIKAAEKSGVNVLDYAYGVDLKTESKLAVYPTLMGELDDPQSNFGGSNSGQDSNNPFGDHNQLGTNHD